MRGSKLNAFTSHSLFLLLLPITNVCLKVKIDQRRNEMKRTELSSGHQTCILNFILYSISTVKDLDERERNECQYQERQQQKKVTRFIDFTFTN